MQEGSRTTKKRFETFVSHGSTCECELCREVTEKLNYSGTALMSKLGWNAKMAMDNFKSGTKTVVLKTCMSVKPVKTSTVDECRDVLNTIESWCPCKACNNVVPCESSKYTIERCTPSEALIIPICSALLFPREFLRTQTSEKDSNISILWTYYTISQMFYSDVLAI